MSDYPQFDDTRGIPGRYFAVWGAATALLMLAEALFFHQIIGALCTLTGLPFMMIANLFVKQGEYYDMRLGYTRANKWPVVLWVMPSVFTVVGFGLSASILIIEIRRGHL